MYTGEYISCVGQRGRCATYLYLEECVGVVQHENLHGQHLAAHLLGRRGRGSDSPSVPRAATAQGTPPTTVSSSHRHNHAHRTDPRSSVLAGLTTTSYALCNTTTDSISI